MKLINILARQIFAWPTAMVRVRQNMNGCLVWLDANGLNTLDSHLQMAEDWPIATVTHNEWIAAVTALKAKEVNFNDPMKMNASVAPDTETCDHSHANPQGCPECGEEFAPAWNGKGLPPVGLDVYVDHTHAGGGLTAVKILAHTEARKLNCAVYQAGDEVSYASSGCFKPIPTAEQIAAEARIASAYAMCAIAPSLSNTDAVALYDALYRKQVAQ